MNILSQNSNRLIDDYESMVSSQEQQLGESVNNGMMRPTLIVEDHFQKSEDVVVDGKPANVETSYYDELGDEVYVVKFEDGTTKEVGANMIKKSLEEGEEGSDEGDEGDEGDEESEPVSEAKKVEPKKEISKKQESNKKQDMKKSKKVNESVSQFDKIFNTIIGEANEFEDENAGVEDIGDEPVQSDDEFDLDSENPEGDDEGEGVEFNPAEAIKTIESLLVDLKAHFNIEDEEIEELENDETIGDENVEDIEDLDGSDEFSLEDDKDNLKESAEIGYGSSKAGKNPNKGVVKKAKECKSGCTVDLGKKQANFKQLKSHKGVKGFGDVKKSSKK